MRVILCAMLALLFVGPIVQAIDGANSPTPAPEGAPTSPEEPPAEEPAATESPAPEPSTEPVESPSPETVVEGVDELSTDVREDLGDFEVPGSGSGSSPSGDEPYPSQDPSAPSGSSEEQGPSGGEPSSAPSEPSEQPSPESSASPEPSSQPAPSVDVPDEVLDLVPLSLIPPSPEGTIWTTLGHGSDDADEGSEDGPVDAAAFGNVADAPAVPATLALTATALIAATTVLAGAGTSYAGGFGLAGLKKLFYRGLTLGTVSLFTRLTNDQLLDHPRRNDIVEYVRQNPGERLELVRKALGLANGPMLHHVNILEHGDLVRVVRVGGMARLYPAGPRVQPSTYIIPVRRRVLDELRTRPGITQREIARVTGLSERAVSYHVGWLHSNGLVNVERSGAAKRCFASPPRGAVAVPG